MVNRVLLVGRLGQKPELKKIGSGETAVVNFTLATNRRVKDETVTEWHRCTAWQKTAENIEKYLDKGSLVYIEGRIETRKWADKDGKDQYTTGIQVESCQFLDSKKKEATPGTAASGGDQEGDKW